jgi:alkaline phosphatase D
MHVASTDVRLVYSDGVTTATTSASTADSDRMVKFALTGLTAGTTYTYQVQRDGKLGGPIGRFKTHPAASGAAASFTVAFAGDAQSGSIHHSFETVRSIDPLMFLHLGDLHYDNNATNSAALFHTSFDTVLRSQPQARLYREVATAYVWDDHDYGINNADGTSATKPAAASAYRSRVPHYSLPHATAIYQTFDIGRVRFIVTDQRSEASPKANTDNSSKSMLGATQKTWFKALLSASTGYAIVWICPRGFGGVGAVAGADWWQGFTTERTEIADHIKANCHGRVIVLCADLHGLGIDDGTHYDFATGGGEPLPTFQAAALDQPGASTGFTYSQGEFTGTGQYGTMAVVDGGGSSIGVTWKGWDSNGVQLATLAFTVNL